ncbi:MAG: cytochrome c3 family protein, partial [Fimbriimonadaceae bacterium]
MAQIFGPAANTIATASLFALAGVPFLLVGVSEISRSPANTKVTVPINQPAPFSHKHHAKELGIDCRFCHTSVEKS